MEINLTTKQKGSSIIVTFLVANHNYGSAMNKSEIRELDIFGLARVKFSIKKAGPRIYVQLMAQKKPIDSNVKLQVFCEKFKYHSERYLTHEEVWDSLGEVTEGRLVMRLDPYTIYVFEVTISAYIGDISILEKLYNDTDSTDFHLSTAEGSVAVHKICLMALSDVFKRMFSQEWKETDKGSMQIPGITLKTLQDLKQYIYIGTLPDDDLLPLLEIALCYLINDLKEKCITRLAFKVKPEDFYSLLQFSMDREIPELTFALMQITPEDVVEKAREMNVKRNIGEESKEE